MSRTACRLGLLFVVLGPLSAAPCQEPCLPHPDTAPALPNFIKGTFEPFGRG